MTAAYQQERLSATEAQRWFLAGFIEGEGSVTVSIKEDPTAQFGYYVDPEFLLYQHREYPQMLELARRIFGTGRIRPKPGDDRVWEFAITSRRSLAEKVVPFLRKYMVYSPRREIYERFCAIVEAMERKEHRTPDGLARIVEQAYALNPAAKGTARKRAVSAVVGRILRDYTPDPRSGGKR